MAQKLVEGTLLGSLGLLALAGVLFSANGVVGLNGIILAILLSLPAIFVSCLLVVCRRYTKRPVVPVIFGPVLVCFLLIISVAATHWPLRLTYAVSRHTLDSLAQRVRAGEQLETPVRAGVFTIRNAMLYRQEVDNEFVCLWINDSRENPVGFVQSSSDNVRYRFCSRGEVLLDDRWQFISTE